mmetsp:Transcript_4227/g.14085  ORF Transcript_4227/g.14085 Transcript_4227/m.14085 type:complete len:251 (-) Transcript_4227:1496-2248(-)
MASSSSSLSFSGAGKARVFSSASPSARGSDRRSILDAAMISARCSRNASAAAVLLAMTRWVLLPSVFRVPCLSRRSLISASTVFASVRAVDASLSQPSTRALAFSVVAFAVSAAAVNRASSAVVFAISASALRCGPTTSRDRSKFSCSVSLARCCVNLDRSSAERSCVSRLCASYSRMFATPTDFEKDAYTASSTACTFWSTALRAARETAHARFAACSSGSALASALSMLESSFASLSTFSPAILMSTA